MQYLNYNATSDVLEITLRDAPVAQRAELSWYLTAGYDAAGNLVALTVLDASETGFWPMPDDLDPTDIVINISGSPPLG